MKAKVCWKTTLLMGASLLALVVAFQAVKEGFASSQGGAQVQLRTSHVPEEGELEEKAVLEAAMIDYGLKQMMEQGL
jgi:hypothetical protein